MRHRDKELELNRISVILGMVLVWGSQGLAFAATDTKEAQAARNKPLLRCDQLTDKAQIDCLTKARERVLEARRKRESTGETRTEQKKLESPPAKDQPQKRPQ